MKIQPMNIASFNKDIEYNDKRIVTKVMMETTFSKEIRIVFLKGQVMKEHKTAHPIVVQVLQGAIDFGVQGTVQHLLEGDIIALEGNIPHDLTAKKDSVVRLTLSKYDDPERVKKAVS